MISQTVLVTGAGGGLGIPVVKHLLAKDWHVIALIRSEEKAKAFMQKIPTKYAAQLSTVLGDVTNSDDIKLIAESIKAIDALVHLAGGFAAAANISVSNESTFNKMFALNTKSTFLLLKHLLPLMKANKRGSIVAIGAKPAIHVGLENAVYAASKAALVNLMLTAAEEGRQDNVRANVIVPGVINTAANRQWASSEKEIGKWTDPADIAKTIQWLISNDSEAVTGTIIPMFHELSS